MKKILIASVAALAIPATAVASETPSAKVAAKSACKQQRAAMGDKTFKATYGANAFGKCISAAAKLEKENISEAKAACAAEPRGKGAKNAYGKCVSSKAKAASKADVKATVNAAKTCGTWRAAKSAEWAKYGTGKNAFGKCVSEQAKAKSA